MESKRQLRYNIGMSKRLLPIVIILVWLTVAVHAEGPPILPAKTGDKLVNFDSRPERNFTFKVADDRESAYRLTQALLLECDYEITANAVERGDQIGPLLSKLLYRRDKLAEAVMIRLDDQGGVTEITVRALYVVPENNYIVDQSRRRPSYAARHFEQLYKAKKALQISTGELSTFTVLTGAKQNLLDRKDLSATLATLEMVEKCTIARSLAGRQARELAHAVRAEINRSEKLNKALEVSRQKIAEAVARRDWLAGHMAADEMIHILLSNGVTEEDPLFDEAEKALAKCRRYLSYQGSLIAFNPQIAPAEENDFAVGFTVVNVTPRPIASFKAIVTTTEAGGNMPQGRIGRNHAYTIELDPSLHTDEYYRTSVRLRFENQAQPIEAKVRIVQVKWGKPKKKN